MLVKKYSFNILRLQQQLTADCKKHRLDMYEICRICWQKWRQLFYSNSL